MQIEEMRKQNETSGVEGTGMSRNLPREQSMSFQPERTTACSEQRPCQRGIQRVIHLSCVCQLRQEQSEQGRGRGHSGESAAGQHVRELQVGTRKLTVINERPACPVGKLTALQGEGLTNLVLGVSLLFTPLLSGEMCSSCWSYFRPFTDTLVLG